MSLNPERARFQDFTGYFGLRERASSPEEQLRRISNALVPVIRNFNAAEGEKRKTVDYDLAFPDQYREDMGFIDALLDGKVSSDAIVSEIVINPPTKVEWRARAKIFSELKKRAEAIPIPKTASLSLQQETMIAVLGAFDTFSRMRGGEIVSITELGEDTQGKTPEIVPEPILEAQRELVRIGFAVRGVSYEARAIEEYRKAQKSKDVISELRDGEKEFFKIVSNAVGKQLYPTIELIEKNEEDEYWINWSSGQGRSFKTAVNVTDRHSEKFTDGRVKLVRRHERVHHAQCWDWRLRIEKKDMLPSLGVTSIVTPIQISCEGIAQTIHEYIPELKNFITPSEELEHDIEDIRQMTYNNIHIMVNTQEVSDSDMVAYMQRFYPAEKEDEIKRQIKERRDDPFKRSYLLAYGEGVRLFKWYAQNLNERGKKELLRFVFDQPTTPEQVYTYFMRLIHDPNQSFGQIIIPYGLTLDDLPTFKSAA